MKTDEKTLDSPKQEMPLKRVTLLVDALFCFLFLPSLLYFASILGWLQMYPSYSCVLIAYSYAIYFVVRKINIPRLFINKKYWQIVSVLILFWLITELLTRYPHESDEVMDAFPNLAEYMITQKVWMLSLVVFGYGLSVSLVLELMRQEERRRRLEEQKIKAELGLYKAQINPHFMFNTLNTLYGMIVSRSDKSEDAFVKFMDMVKYSYTYADRTFVDIGNEIRYIEDYIGLQSLRLNGHTHVEWSKDIDDDKSQIPPMLLITFVENAFKYGTSSSDDCTISVRIVLENGLLDFSTVNNIMNTSKKDEQPIGIENCKARLQLLYPERFSLSAARDGDIFKVNLKIQLQ